MERLRAIYIYVIESHGTKHRKYMKDQTNNNNPPQKKTNDNLIKTINEHNNFQALESWRK